MANVNFFLKEPKSKEPTLIYLRFNFNGQVLKFSTGEKVLPKNWNKGNQKVAKNFTGFSQMNDLLSSMSETVLGAYRSQLAIRKEVTPDFLRAELLKSLNKETSSPKGFFSILEEYIQIKQGKLTPNYLKKVTTLKNHLKEFEKVKKFKISFGKIDLSFYDSFTSFLMIDRNQLNNTIGTNISVLKTFLIWATGRGHNSNMKFKDKEFKAQKQEGDIIYLTEPELMKIFELDLSQNPRLDKVRDSFCFSCFTGLRFSDVAKISKENINGDELQVITTKTKTSLRIPLNGFAMEILERNDFKIRVISNQKTNSYLKELAEMAEINESVIITKFRGVEEVEKREPKCNFITSHTARRTFVTLSLEKGMRAETVMEITGHKCYKMFKKYIRITDKIKRIEMNRVWSRETTMKKVV